MDQQFGFMATWLGLGSPGYSVMQGITRLVDNEF